MVEDYISKKDRIISTAIDIISESGISALTTRNIAIKENMSEALLYKYYGNIDEVLQDVIDYYFKFDKGIRATINAKNVSYIDKVKAYVDSYAVYYDNYYALSVIMLQYEELLHNINTRDKIADGVLERGRFLEELFDGAIKAKEIKDVMTSQELSVMVSAVIVRLTLNRRFVYNKDSFQSEMNRYISKLMDILKFD
ncbi:TetR/AcrR family transcriptional regulator [Eubacterium ruminantium]|uniref:TetR/AcrR family transcriptional regulator n=1 Tax=Eubacterium ruminantium TaxID=42322 RepID=UPI001569F31A|nr:TetR/AcrR family transcriptional regulator [Eubacterium ruminantium]